MSTAAEKACVLHNAGNFYNLNPLSAGKDYVLKSLGGHELILNVCRSVLHETWALKIPNSGDVGAFIRLDRGDFSIGSVKNMTLSLRGSTPVLQLASGSTCGTDSRLTASTAIQFICDHTLSGQGSPTLIAQLPPGDDDTCALFFEWRTPFACPISESSFWSMLLVALVSVVVVFLLIYLVGGFLYNRFVLKLRGSDQIPQFSLTALKYHASSVWEIICDTFQILHQSALGAPTPRTDRTANMSVSHHFRHTTSTPSTTDPDTPVSANEMDPNGIIRL